MSRPARRAVLASAGRHRASKRRAAWPRPTIGTMKNFIDGEWVDPSGGTDTVFNPATGEELAQAPVSSPEDVDRAVKAAVGRLRGLVEHHAGRARARPDPPGRRARGARRRDRRARDRQRRQAGRRLQGRRAAGHGRQPALLRRAARARSRARPRASTSRATRRSSAARRSARSRRSRPWNYPLMMAIWKIGPALAAGNTIVLKPAETTPLTTLKLGEIAAEFLPKGVLNVIGGRGETGQALVQHPDIRMVSLTGSVETGKWIARAAADTLKRVHLELGGKAPVVDLRRRRHGGRARDDRRHGLLQRRPGLHGGHARARRRQGLRRRRQRPRRAGQGLQDGRPLRRGDDARPGQLPAPARARRGLHRARARPTPRSSPAASSPTSPATGSSRPSSAASSRTTR